MKRLLPILAVAVLLAAAVALLGAGNGKARSAGACSVTQKRSISGTVKTTIAFTNKTAAAVQLYWLDYKGHLVYYNTVPPGKTVRQATWKTHAWLVLDPSFRCVGYVIAPRAQYTVG